MEGIPASQYLRVAGGQGAERLRAGLSARLGTIQAPMTVKVNALTHVFNSGAIQPLCSIWRSPGNFSWYAGIEGGGLMTWGYSTDGSTPLLQNSTLGLVASAHQVHDWLSFIFLVSPTNVDFYVEGVQLGTSQVLTGANDNTGIADWNLGSDDNLSVLWPGSINQLEIFDTLKDGAWVAANWDQRPNKLDPDLVAGYDFEGGSLVDFGSDNEDLTLFSGSAVQEFPTMVFT